MKYWLLTTEYPPQFGGGIGTYCYQWCSILKQKGAKVTVFIPDKNESVFKESFQEGVRIITFAPNLSNTAAFLGYETMISYSFADIIEKYLQKEGIPDWLEAQEYNGIAYYILQKKHLAYPLFKELNIAVTCHCPSFFTFKHNHVNTFQLPYFWIGEMERYSIKAADVCISPSQYLVTQLHQHYPSLKREYNILPNPYTGKGFENVGGDINDEVLFIGKLSPAKGVLHAIKEFKKLWDKGYSTRLKLVGDQNYYYHAVGSTMGAFLKNKYATYIESGLLVIAGTMPPKEVGRALTAAKLLIVPSTIENLPYTVIESMAAGKAVLTSVQGGQSELITDGENGFLFDYENQDSLEEKLLQVLQIDNDALTVIGKAGALTIATVCDPEAYYKAKIKILEEAAVNKIKVDYPFIYNIPLANESIIAKEGVKDLLTVIVPYYNMGRYINATIDSIRQSAYQNIEIVIVDDGSTDQESIAALEKYRQQKDIKIIRQPNMGLPQTRNNGAQAAKGEFIAFLDADDKISKHYYSKAIEVLREKNKIHFVGCWVKYFGGSNHVWPAFNPEPPYLLFHNMINSSGLVYKRNSFLQHGMNDKSFLYGMEDYDSVLSLVENGLRGVVLPEIHFYYRVRKDSMARGFNKSNMSYLYWLLTQKHIKLYTTFAAEITNLLNVNGPGYQYENPTLDYHIHSGNTLYDRIIRKLMLKVKQQPLLRKIALSTYKLIKS